MNTHFDVLRQTRHNILNVVEPFSNKELNFIPPGFNNNLAWNLGHVLVTQQLLCYRLSGLACHINDDLIDRFRKGTKPGGRVLEDDILMIKDHLQELANRTETDHRSGKFQEYKDYPTSFGVTLHGIEDALQFNNVHEGMHLGTMMGIRKLL